MPPKRTDLLDNESVGDRSSTMSPHSTSGLGRRVPPSQDVPVQSSATKTESGTVSLARILPRALVRQSPIPTGKVPVDPPKQPFESVEPQLPKPPKLPTELGAAEIHHTPAVAGKPKAPRNSTAADDAEECTRAYPPEIVDALLRSSGEIRSTPPPSVAGTNTRFGASPIEEPVVARHWERKGDFGYDDVTQVYDPGVDADLTAPSRRALYSKIPRVPSVALRTAPPGARHLLGAAVLAALLGVCFWWAYRSPTLSQLWRIDDKSRTSSSNVNADGSHSNKLTSSMITLSISVSPPEAVLLVDGRNISNPYFGQRSSDKLGHLIVAEAPGHVTLSRNVQFDRDLAVVMALAPQPERASLPSEQPSAGALNSLDIPRVRPAAKARSASQPTNTTKSTLDCNPPFTIDADGVKTYKLQCVAN